MLSHELLLLGGTRLPGGHGDFNTWRWVWSNRCPLVELSAEEVGLVGEENVSTFDFPEIEALSRQLLRTGHQRIDERSHEVAESLGVVDDVGETVLFFGLEGQVWKLVLPGLKVLELWASRVAWDLDAVIADGTSILVIFFDFAARNLETLAVIPGFYQ